MSLYTIDSSEVSQAQANAGTPGSKEALAAGCTCAVLDNCHGAGFPYGTESSCFWVSGDCPIHGGRTISEEEYNRNRPADDAVDADWGSDGEPDSDKDSSGATDDRTQDSGKTRSGL
jgi:hypothetical protein